MSPGRRNWSTAGRGLRAGPRSAAASRTWKMNVGELSPEWYEGSAGYDPAFLGTSLDTLRRSPPPGGGHRCPSGGGRDSQVTHFSVVMSRSLHSRLHRSDNDEPAKALGRDTTSGTTTEIDRSLQSGPDLYEGNDLDHGHQVRRTSTLLGEDAQEANEDTFHLTTLPAAQEAERVTGCARGLYPHHRGKFGSGDCHHGPVFREDDSSKGRVPDTAEFWKVRSW